MRLAANRRLSFSEVPRFAACVDAYAAAKIALLVARRIPCLVLNMTLLAYWSDRAVSAHAEYITAAQQPLSPGLPSC